jgi:energy-coupling factor transporter transmembrane protein EcfT
MRRGATLENIHEHAAPWLSKQDPRVKICWLLCISVISILVETQQELAGLFFLAALPAVGLRLRPRGWLVIGGLLLSIAWGTILTQAIFYGGTPRTVWFTLVPEFELGGWHGDPVYFYVEGALYGLQQSQRLLAMALAGLTVCLSTSPQRLLAGMTRLGLPMAIGFMSVAAVRFLPTMLNELATVRQARRLRGYRFRVWPITTGVRNMWQELALCEPVLSAALRRASTLATSITTRGFDALSPRTFYPELKLSLTHGLFLVGLVFFTLTLMFCRIFQWLDQGGAFDGPALGAALRWFFR